MGYSDFDDYMLPFEEKQLLENHMTPEQAEIQDAVHEVQNLENPPLEELVPFTEQLSPRELADVAHPGILNQEASLASLLLERTEIRDAHIEELNFQIQERLDEIERLQTINAGFRIIDGLQRQADHLMELRQREETGFFNDTADMNLQLDNLRRMIDAYAEEEEQPPEYL